MNKESIDIKKFWSYFKRYILIFAILVILAVSGVFMYNKTIKTPVYHAQTTVNIIKSGTGDNASGTINDINASQKLAIVYGEIAKSDSVLDKVIKDLGLHSSLTDLKKDISTKVSNTIAMITISVSNSDANTSAMIANKIVDVSTEEIQKTYKVGTIEQLGQAAVPVSPSNNSTIRDSIIIVALLSFAMFIFVFVKYYYDRTIRYDEEIEKTIGLSVAGVIPEADIKTRRSNGMVTIEKYPVLAVNESFKILRANLQFAVASKRFKTLLVTSANVGEGKTFVAANLAMAFAQAGKKVLLVDTDLRSGNLYKLFDISNEKGLAEYLAGNGRDFDRYIEEVKNKDLFVMPCGKHPTNPSELLSSRKCKELIKSLSDIYDIVIFDGAPVNGYADSIVMASYADETLMVVKDASTKDDDFKAAENALEKVGAKITGVVMNRVESTPKYKIN